MRDEEGTVGGNNIISLVTKSHSQLVTYSAHPRQVVGIPLSGEKGEASAIIVSNGVVI